MICSLAHFLATDQSGEVSINGIMMMGIGMVFLAVGFTMFPISTTACTSLLNYEYSANTSITDATFTGFSSIVGITPLLILVGYLAAAVITGFMGYKMFKGGGSTNIGPGSMLMLGMSIVFISIGLIIEPVMLDGVANVLSNGGTGISASFTGLDSVMKLAPILVHLAFISASVITGYFGIKSMK